MRALLSRAAMLAISLWLIVTIAFLAVYALPGDPARMILGQRATADTVETFRVKAGLNVSLYTQYLGFVKRTAKLDFGMSLAQRRPVVDLIQERLPITSILVLCNLALVWIVSFILPLTLYSLRLPNLVAAMEKFCSGVASIPPYVCAVAALVIFAEWLNWVPALFEMTRLSSWVLPSLVLAAFPAGVFLRLFEQQLRVSLSSPYSLRARSLGFHHTHILLWEALPNALTPALAALANGLAYFLTGAFFVEVAFGIPGVGGLTYESVRNKDMPVLVASCILFAIVVTFVSAVLEAALSLLNPRSRRRSA